MPSYERSETALLKFVHLKAGPELRDLERLGGPKLRWVAERIYVGFGMNPGEDEQVATNLKSLPMHIDRRLPSFSYEHDGRTRLILQHTDRRNIHSIGFTVRGTDTRLGHSAVRPAQTQVLERFIDGTQAIHAATGQFISRGNLYIHFIFTTIQTAQMKGLTW